MEVLAYDSYFEGMVFPYVKSLLLAQWAYLRTAGFSDEKFNFRNIVCKFPFTALGRPSACIMLH